MTEILVLWMRKGDNTSQPEFTVKNAKLRVEKVVSRDMYVRGDALRCRGTLRCGRLVGSLLGIDV